LNRRSDAVGDYFKETAALQQLAAEACADAIVSAADLVVAALRAGAKVLLCGNGGSAADCQHVAAELVGLLNRGVPRPGLAAIALTTDTSFLTAYGNDFGFEGVFARQVQALGKAGDVLVAISTSGRSENVRRAVKEARERGLRTVGLMGDGGLLAAEVDCAIVIPGRNTQHVQEVMLPIEHLICQLVEQEMFGGGPS
jgi:D-sedoheptulose 7-phosphate isomerase